MALNVLKVKNGRLCPTDVYTTLVMLNVHAVALSATLSSKEALASRWYVGLAVIVQCLAWVAGIKAILLFAKPQFYCSGCWCCLNLLIFPPLTSCPLRPYERFGGLVYWISQLYNVVQPAVVALMHTSKFDSDEKVDRDHRRINDAAGMRTITAYGSLPSTAFSIWRGFALYPPLLIVAVETHLRGHDLTVPDWGEWGQTTALVACACGVGHWVWVNLHNLRLYYKSRGTIVENDRMLPVNVSRLVLMGAKPPTVSADDIRLVTNGTSEVPQANNGYWSGVRWRRVPGRLAQVPFL